MRYHSWTSHRTATIAALAVLLYVCSNPVRAAIDAIDMSLEELLKVRIVSVPKFSENPDQIPSTVSVLTAADIRAYGWRTLGDALRTLQGFNVTEDHTYSYAGIRGIAQPGDYRPRMQILIDGLSINENVFASVPVDSAFPLDIGLIERIEVIRGPSASVYGGDAMFGVINVVTRGNADVAGTEIALGTGSGASRSLRATWTGQLGDAEALFSASGFRAGGRALRVNDISGDGSATELHGIGAEDGKQLFVKLRGTDWRLTVLHSERERVVPTGSYATIPDDRGHVETDRYSLFDLAKDWKLDAYNTLQQRLYAGQYGYDGTFPYDYSPADPRLLNIDRIRGTWWGFDNRLVNTGWSGHRLTFGLEYHANVRQDQMNYDRGYGCYDSGSTFPCLDDRQHSQQITFLAQDEIQIDSANLLTVGLRYDRLGSLGSFWSPRLGLVHDAGTAGLFKLLYGSAFRAPSVYERAYLTPTFSYGNPDLRSEKMDSLEFSWEKRFAPSSRLSATAYYFEVQRMVFTDAATGNAINGLPVKARGLEVEYETRWKSGAHLRAGYTLQRAATVQGQLDNSPQHMAKLNLALPAGFPHLMAGLEGQWIGRRLADFGTKSVDPYLVANLNLDYAPPGNAWGVSLGIYNLFNRRYSDPISPDMTIAGPRWLMPQLGRSVRVTATFRY